MVSHEASCFATSANFFCFFVPIWRAHVTTNSRVQAQLDAWWREIPKTRKRGKGKATPGGKQSKARKREKAAAMQRAAEQRVP